MSVKCVICGKQIEKDSAYVINMPYRNYYYCSFDEYKQEEKEKEERKKSKDRVYYKICDIFGVNEIEDTSLYKEWSLWNLRKPNDDIFKYLMENTDRLCRSLNNKQFDTIYQKIRYFSAILKSELPKYTPPKEKPRIEEVIQINDPIANKMNRRRSMEDLEDDDD